MSRRLHLSAEHRFTMAALMLVMLATAILPYMIARKKGWL